MEIHIQTYIVLADKFKEMCIVFFRNKGGEVRQLMNDVPLELSFEDWKTLFRIQSTWKFLKIQMFLKIQFSFFRSYQRWNLTKYFFEFIFN